MRGIAVLLVLAAHAHFLPEGFGSVGVGIFFSLSGFLITSLLLEEWDRSGKISLGNFYARRALRILPALLLLLAAFMAYAAIGRSATFEAVAWRETVASLLYISNWAQAFGRLDMDFLRHTWSLSIEEQFYLLWPLTLLIMLGRASRSSIVCFTLLGAFLSWIWKVLIAGWAIFPAVRMGAGTDTRADSLLWGCAGAMLLMFGLVPSSRWVGVALRLATPLAVAGLGAIGYFFEISGIPAYLVAMPMVAICSTVIILQLMAAPTAVSTIAFGNSALRYIGKISYGLYLWDLPVTRAVEQTTWPPWVSGVVALPIVVLMTLASYYLLERPCLRLKSRFSTVG
jgi:peptidoglycan/LPS O-acetylase OafA/YrhL